MEVIRAQRQVGSLGAPGSDYKFRAQEVGQQMPGRASYAESQGSHPIVECRCVKRGDQRMCMGGTGEPQRFAVSMWLVVRLRWDRERGSLPSLP